MPICPTPNRDKDYSLALAIDLVGLCSAAVCHYAQEPLYDMSEHTPLQLKEIEAESPTSGTVV